MSHFYTCHNYLSILVIVLNIDVKNAKAVEMMGKKSKYHIMIL